MSLTEFQRTAIAEAVKAALEVASMKAATGNPAAPYAHGPGGVFSTLMPEHPVVSAMVQPRGVLAKLPIIGADDHVTEFLEFFTGVTAGSGAEMDNNCDDPPVPGLKKVCTLAVPFFRLTRATRELDKLRLAKLRDVYDTFALSAQFPMSPYEPDRLNPPSEVSTAGNDITRNEWRDRLYELAVEMQRLLCVDVWTGNPAANVGTGRLYGIGLDLWINAGNKLDAYSSAVCHALDSDVKDFGWNPITGTTPDIYRTMKTLYDYVNWNARSMRLDPATWAWVMRPDLFYELARIWPCRDATEGCSNPAGTNVVVVNDDYNREQQDSMLNGEFLWVRGKQIPVWLDTCIPEDDWIENQNLLQGEYASSVYLLNTTFMGGRTAAGIQYIDQRRTVAANALPRAQHLWASDSGLYLWGNSDYKVLCEQMQATIEWRLLVFAPFLCGRIDRVKYAPPQHMREALPDDKYFLDGGVTERPTTNFYNMWSTVPYPPQW